MTVPLSARIDVTVCEETHASTFSLREHRGEIYLGDRAFKLAIGAGSPSVYLTCDGRRFRIDGRELIAAMTRHIDERIERGLVAMSMGDLGFGRFSVVEGRPTWPRRGEG